MRWNHTDKKCSAGNVRAGLLNITTPQWLEDTPVSSCYLARFQRRIHIHGSAKLVLKGLNSGSVIEPAIAKVLAARFHTRDQVLLHRAELQNIRISGKCGRVGIHEIFAPAVFDTQHLLEVHWSSAKRQKCFTRSISFCFHEVLSCGSNALPLLGSAARGSQLVGSVFGQGFETVLLLFGPIGTKNLDGRHHRESWMEVWQNIWR